MNNYRDQLKEYLSSHTPDYGYPDLHSLLEMLWSYYSQCNPIDSEGIRTQLLTLQPVMDALPNELSNQLFDVVFRLYEEIERTAFLEGIHVGVRLVAELTDWKR